jgi:hypothetical protein
MTIGLVTPPVSSVPKQVRQNPVTTVAMRRRATPI